MVTNQPHEFIIYYGSRSNGLTKAVRRKGRKKEGNKEEIEKREREIG